MAYPPEYDSDQSSWCKKFVEIHQKRVPDVVESCGDCPVCKCCPEAQFFLKEEITQEEKLQVYHNMRDCGAIFVVRLAGALIQADEDNTRRIKEAWPEYWAKYLKMGEDDADSNPR